MGNFIHPTAVIETTDIGDNNYIGPFTYISERVRIGDNCKILGASIGLPGEHPNYHIDQGGFVNIGNNVEIREYVTINAPIFGGSTFIDDGCYLMAKSHIGHDAHLKERVVLHTGSVVGGHSVIGAYCYMGLNCSTHPKAVLGNFCIVGANSFYKGQESVSAIVWVGTPAIPIKVNHVGLERHANTYSSNLLESITKQAQEFIDFKRGFYE